MSLVLKALKSRLGLGCLVLGLGSTAVAQDQTLRTYHLAAVGCATEGAEISIAMKDGAVVGWSGSMCASYGCAIFELSDLAGNFATLNANRSYSDGGHLAYKTLVNRSSADWSVNSSINLDHAAMLEGDVRLVQNLFALSERAVADGKSELSCN
jgi:hypothetical protein